MTEDKLKQGNGLDREINGTKRVLESIKMCSRDIELSGYGNSVTQDFETVIIKADSKSCEVNKVRLIEFLSKESSMEEDKLSKLNEQFKQL